MAEQLVPIARAARETGIPYQTLWRLVHAGRIPSVEFAGLRRVRLSQVRGSIREIGDAA